MSLDINAIPNPPGSPIEKILSDTVWENIEPHVRSALSENPTKDEILRAFSYYDRVLADYIQRHEDALTYWANIHTHDALAEGGGSEFPQNGLLAIRDTMKAVENPTAGGTLTWNPKASPPLSCSSGMAERITDDEVWTHGANGTQVYNSSTDTWDTRAPHPISNRQVAAVGYANGKVYLAGGSSEDGTVIHDDLYVYDVATDVWSALAPLPEATHQAAGVVVEGSFYMVGGATSGTTARSTLYRYRIDTDAWSTEATMPAASRVGGATPIPGGFLFMGINTADCFFFNTTSRAWIILAGRTSTTGMTYVDQFEGVPFQLAYGSAFLQYDVDADTWTSRTSPSMDSRTILVNY